jgi:dolichyl-diphosphooligosaccharide--protein glycosyltransferase/undecaprenyl-diphosphooligosaccharide--protein glycosyltransferase
MLNILPTVSIFSNRDLHTGKEKKKMLFYKSQGFKNNKGVLSLGRGMVCDTNSGMMLFGKQKTKIKYIITTELTNNGHTRVANTKQFDKNGDISLIYMKNYGSILVVNNNMLNSTYIRLFVLENYDKNLFELVISNPYAKVYKLKI